MSRGMSRDERKQRRKQMAMCVARGKSLLETAQRFKVTTTTVANACIENGVLTGSDRLRNPRSREFVVIQILAQLIEGTATTATIAEHVGVSHWRVQRVYERAIVAGIKLPSRGATETQTTERNVNGKTGHSDDDSGSSIAAP